MIERGRDARLLLKSCFLRGNLHLTSSAMCFNFNGASYLEEKCEKRLQAQEEAIDLWETSFD